MGVEMFEIGVLPPKPGFWRFLTRPLGGWGSGDLAELRTVCVSPPGLPTCQISKQSDKVYFDSPIGQLFFERSLPMISGSKLRGLFV